MIINNNLLLSQSIHNIVDDGDTKLLVIDNDALGVEDIVEMRDSPFTDRLVSFTAYSVVYGTLL